MRSLPVYDLPGLANSHAIWCPLRASFAHLEFFEGFCSSQKWWCLSVKLRNPECPSRSVQVLISENTAIAQIVLSRVGRERWSGRCEGQGTPSMRSCQG